MTPERWQEIERIYHAALKLESGQRATFLKHACANDDVLLREIESMFAYSKPAESSLRVSVLEEPDQAPGANPAESEAGFQVGQTISRYRILQKLGAGGMGVVYKAEDTKLGRWVALKFLPREFAQNQQALQRFRREAQSASALNHPSICTIHDIDEHAGQPFIVMELLEGQTLDHYIKKGKPLQTGQLLDVSIQIADALDAAHSRDIVHRDIKPASIFVTSHGQAKLLDFGLAKLLARPRCAAVAAGGSDQPTAAGNIQHLTTLGVAVGTVAYMSPEQARGENLDSRTDLFSFGVVLYEMATGILPFKGDTAAVIFDAILNRTATSPFQLNPEIPTRLEEIIGKALEKECELRYQNASELRADLKRLKRDSDSGFLVSAPGIKRTQRRSMIWLSVLLAGLILTSVAVWFYESNSGASKEPLTAIPLTSFPGYEVQASFSPDGNQVAFVWDGENQEASDIYVKLIGSGPPLRLTNNAAADFSPAWSPDGRWIAFLRELSVDKADVMLVSALGGPERKLTEIESPFRFHHHQQLAWSQDGKLLVLPDRSSAGQGFFLFSIDTGEKRQLTFPPAGFSDHSPALAPNGSTLAFIRANQSDFGDIYLQKLAQTLTANGEPKRISFMNRSAYSLAWTPDGREIIFAAGLPDGMSLWRMAAKGSARSQRLAWVGEPGSEPAVSKQGHRLVYTHFLWDENIWRIGMAGPQGPDSSPTHFISSTLPEAGPQYSPDGRKIVFASGRSSRSGGYEIWLCDSDGSNAVQLTTLDAESGTPRWSPNGELIVFDSNVQWQWEIYVVSANGGRPQRLTTNPASDSVPSFSADGKWIYFASDRSGEQQVWKMPASGGEEVQITRKGGFAASESPDGKFVYYAKSNRTGGLWKVAVGGGVETEVLTSIVPRAFVLVPEGIYYISQPVPGDDYVIQFLNLSTGKTRRVVSIGKPLPSGLTVSSDGHWFLYPQLDQAGSDLMLVENFR